MRRKQTSLPHDTTRQPIEPAFSKGLTPDKDRAVPYGKKIRPQSTFTSFTRTVRLGGSSGIFGANIHRNYLLVQNLGPNPVSLGFNTTPAANSGAGGVIINPGFAIAFENGIVTNQTINGRALGGDTTISTIEGTYDIT